MSESRSGPLGEVDLTQIFDTMSDLVSVHDEDMLVVRANKALLEYLGKKEEEVLGKHCFEVIHGTSEPWPDCPHRKCVRSQKSATEEIKDTRTGATLLVTASPLYDASGKFFGSVHVARDITDRKKDADLLRESEEKYSNLFDNSNDSIFLHDTEGTILEVNRMALEQLGYTHDELVGFDCRLLHPPSCLETCGSAFEAILQKGSFRFEILFTRKDGSTFQAEVSSSLFEVKGRKVVQAVVRDVSERINAEQALKRYTEQVVAANYFKDLFTDILSHDLLNPAFVIKNMIELVARRKNPDYADQFEIILRNSKKLLELIQDSSTYVNIANVESFEKKEADLVEILARIINRLGPQFDAREIEILFSPGREALVPVNPVVDRVFENILSNCLKYAPRTSSATVVIKETDEGFLVSVSNEGEKVPDRYKKSIFERFSRGERRGVKGTGLGLAIAKRIVDLHQGRIWVEDQDGEGCVFRVFLPRPG